MDWSNCVEAFIQVADNKSFAKAAEHLHTTSSAVTKRIQWLEHQLGASLFRRTTRRVDLTEAGAEFYQKAFSLWREWQQLKVSMQDRRDDLSGVLRVAATPHLTHIYLVNIIDQFMAEHPNVVIELYESSQAIHLLEEQIDVYIGFNHFVLDPATTIGVKLSASYRQCFASPGYIEKYGEPATIDALDQHRCLVFLQRKTWRLGERDYTPKSCFYTDSPEAMLHAACAGMGIVHFTTAIIQDLLAEGKLKLLLPECRSPDAEIYACYPKLPYMPKKVRLFLDHLKANLKLVNDI